MIIYLEKENILERQECYWIKILLNITIRGIQYGSKQISWQSRFPLNNKSQLCVTEIFICIYIIIHHAYKSGKLIKCQFNLFYDLE